MRDKIITAIKDLMIAHRNLQDAAELLEGENKKEMQKICGEIMMTAAWMKAYNLIKDSELDFD